MEILQNTIFKLVIRQGPDSDRLVTMLTSGEPAYTTDTQRLYIGTGTLSGGVVVGNIFQGSSTNITTFTESVVGDLAYDIDKRKLYRLEIMPPTDLNNWECIGGVYSAGDSYISISADNELSLNALSANSVSSDLVKGPIILDSGRISLSSNIPITAVSTNTITVSSGLYALGNGVNVTNTAVNPLSSNLVIQSNQLYAKYSGLSGQTLNYAKNITSVSWLSAGHYRFHFDALPTANLIPNVQIYGIDALGYEPRTISLSNSSCDVKILSSNGASTDANITLLLSY